MLHFIKYAHWFFFLSYSSIEAIVPSYVVFKNCKENAEDINAMFDLDRVLGDAKSTYL